ncbi:MAG: dolichyl-phosphate-mannose-protein mannosyltransferase [Firmicutes bacterium]|nr:dolichyl-phosphate-mannose-protein mannosyltransferase [Bacillota bacterium]
MKRKYILLLCTVFVNLLYNFFLPLHPDEAYYWVWSKNLQLSYYDHPPLVAYLIKFFTLFGNSEWTIRLASVAVVTASAWMVYLLARKMFSLKVAELSLILFLFLPIVQISFQVVTPDVPLLFFWTMTLYLAYGAIFESKQSFLYLSGITMGLLLLSKYTGILLASGLIIFLLTTSYRPLLWNKSFYVTMGLAIGVFSPVLLWNGLHNWVSFHYQLDHGIGQVQTTNWLTLIDYWQNQMLVANPIIFVGLLYYCLKYIRKNVTDAKLAFLLWPFLFVVLFFNFTAITKKVEANWPLPAYVTGSILLAYWLEANRKKSIAIAGAVVTVILLVVVRFPEKIPFWPNNINLKVPYYGYKELFQQGNKYLPVHDPVILSDTYQNASMAWYYLSGQPHVYILTSSLHSNYEFWNEKLINENVPEALYFGGAEQLPVLQRRFEHIEVLDVLIFNNCYVNRTLYVVKCYHLVPYTNEQ